MRNRLVLALAPHIGNVLTAEAARAIVEQFDMEGRAIDISAIEPQQCGTLTFQAERLRDIIPEMHLLHEVHWLETERSRHGEGLHMDYDELCLEEQNGTMIQFTARAAGALVGNFRLYLRRDRHTGRRLAEEDTWYLLPEYRRGRNALRFLEYPRTALRAMGYRKFKARVSDENPAAGRLLGHRGFEREPKTTYILDEEKPHVLA